MLQKATLVFRALGSLLLLLPMLYASSALGQDQESAEERVLGVWRMDPRVLYSPGVVYYQEDGTVSVMDKMPDGTFRVMSRVSTRAVAESDDLLIRPGCVGKKECFYDDATEGIGTVFRNTLRIDWIDEGWIDDLLTLEGNVMTGDDGNGLIRLVKED